MKSKLAQIARYLTTRTDGKKHGFYYVYEDDKIMIHDDSYGPGLQIKVNIDGEFKLVAHWGHSLQTYHGGAWEGYVADTVYPRVAAAKEKHKAAKLAREQKEHQKNFGPVNDAATFA